MVVQLRRHLEAGLDHGDADGDGGARSADPAGAVGPYRDLRRTLIGVQTRELQRLYETNAVSDTTRRRIQRVLDLEDAGLTG